jgi:hypothetical protein
MVWWFASRSTYKLFLTVNTYDNTEVSDIANLYQTTCRRLISWLEGGLKGLIGLAKKREQLSIG